MSLRSPRPLVVIAMNAFRPGGSQSYAFTLARMLQQRGYSTVLVGKSGSWLPRARSVSEARSVIWQEGTAYPNQPWHKRALLTAGESISARLLRKVIADADLIVTSQPGPTAFFSRWSSFWPKASRVALVHGTSEVEWPFRDHEETTRGLDAIFAATAEAYSLVARCHPLKRVDCLGNLYRADLFWGKDHSEVVAAYDKDGPVVFLNTLTSNKTPPLYALLGAMQSTERKLIVVGGGPEFENVTTRISSLGLSSRVVMAGATDDPRQWISSSSVVVTAGRGAIEAMSAGRPVVIATSDGCHGLARSKDLQMLRSYNFTGRTPSSLQNNPETLGAAVAEAEDLEDAERLALARSTAAIGSIDPLCTLIERP